MTISAEERAFLSTMVGNPIFDRVEKVWRSQRPSIVSPATLDGTLDRIAVRAAYSQGFEDAIDAFLKMVQDRENAVGESEYLKTNED